MSTVQPPAQPPPLPPYVTDENGSIEALLSEIARQKAKKDAGFFGSTAGPHRPNEPEEVKTAGNKGNADDDEQSTADMTGLVAMSCVEPLKRVIPSEKVLRKFLHKYVIARSGRIESAAERVLNLCEIVPKYPHLTTRYNVDVAKGLSDSLGCVRAFPITLTKDGNVLFHVIFRNLDWDKVSVEQFEKAMFFLLFAMIMIPTHPAQLNGIVMTADSVDVGPSNIKMSFELFMLRLMSQCLPLRLKGFYMLDAPRFIRWLVWPPISVTLSEKLRQRVFFVDDVRDIERAIGSEQWAMFGGTKSNQSRCMPNESDMAFILQWTTDQKAPAAVASSNSNATAENSASAAASTTS